MSQALQCTQFAALICRRRPPLGSFTISYTPAGQKFSHGLPYSFVQRSTQMEVSCNLQVHGLRFVVHVAGEEHRSESIARRQRALDPFAIRRGVLVELLERRPVGLVLQRPRRLALAAALRCRR